MMGEAMAEMGWSLVVSMVWAVAVEEEEAEEVFWGVMEVTEVETMGLKATTVLMVLESGTEVDGRGEMVAGLVEEEEEEEEAEEVVV